MHESTADRGAETRVEFVRAAPSVPLGTTLRRFWPFLRPYRLQALLVVCAGLALPALEAATVWLFKLVVDRVLVPRALGSLGWIALGYLAVALAGALLGFCTDVLSTQLSERFLLDLRVELFRHVQGVSVDFLERRRLGDLLSRITSDAAAVEDFLLSGAVHAAEHVVRFAIFTVALFWLEWRLAIVALLVAPLFWAAARVFSRKLREVSRERRRYSAAVASVAEESLSNAPLVQAYGGSEREVARFRKEGESALRAQMRSARLRAVYAPIVDLLEMAGVLVVFAAGTWALSRNLLTMGGLLAFVAYLSKLYRPVRGLGSYANVGATAAAAAERILELLDEPPALRTNRGAVRLDRPRGIVELDNVSFRYPGAAELALRGVSFRISPGETLALVGASGSGKSTIFKLLLRFFDPTEGRVLLDGHDVRDLDPDSLRRAIAVLFQEALLFHASMRENIAYGRPGASATDIDRAARLADAAEFIALLDGGLDADAGQKGRRLSGGQRQRIAIARAMVRDAPVLLLDEPTTGLDAASEQRILIPLQRLMRDRTTIVAAHDLRLLQDATRILLLEHGSVVESGTHAELMKRGERYAWFYRLREGAPAARALAGASS